MGAGSDARAFSRICWSDSGVCGDRVKTLEASVSLLEVTSVSGTYWQRLSNAPLTLKEGFSVVAPISCTQPFST